jgi:molybdopterin converting factor small subunit
VKIELLYFAQLRDAFGDGDTMVVNSDATVGDVVATIRGRDEWRAVKDLPLRYAVNEVVVDENTALRDGDTLALLPPVSGG